MKFFIVGLGSMGKRRIRNLFANGEKDIIGFDIRADRNEEAKQKYGIRIVDFSHTKPEDFDALIISTSPEAHGNYIRYAIQHRKHFFIEHPTNDDGYADIFADPAPTVKAPSCTMRFYTPIVMIKKLLDAGRIGKVLAFQYQMGQYLPDWHPWEDYRTVYFSKKETSACREMLPFELTWLNWLMGSRVADISGTIKKVSDLDMDADDVVLATVRYGNGILGNILIDVISRKPVRTLRVLGSDGVLDWERFDHEIKIFHADSKTEEIIPVPKGNPETGYVNEEEMYVEEMKAFLDAIAGRAPYPYTFEENLSSLNALFQLVKNPKP
ncbi:MAG: Gfo/Idh/MocA family oxidoreductase [Patescibacteria group bacterium]